MDQPARFEFKWRYVAVAAAAIIGMWAFLEDIIKADWVAYLVSPLSVAIFLAILWRAKSGSFARDALWFVALLVFAYVSIYDVLDLILDPLIRSDVLIAGTALVVLAVVWSSLSAVIAVEEN